MPDKNDTSLQQSSVAWSDSILYTGGDFPRYNPDDLLTRKGNNIYQRMMNDEQVKAVVRFRRDAISGREWGFQFDEDVTLSEDEQTKRIAIFNSAITNLRGSFKDKLNVVLTSMHNGFSISEPVYELFNYKGAQYWGVEDIVKKPFDTFYFVTDQFGNLIELYQVMDGVKNELDIGSLIHHVQNPDHDTYYGKSELREAYRSWFSKDVVIKLFNIHLERHASGFLWIGEMKDSESAMPNAGTADHTSLVNIINNFQTRTGILLPAGLEAHLESPNNTDAFEKAIAMYDKGIAKALLMPNLMGYSEDSGVGSQARAQTQLESFLWILDSEAKAVEETLNEQLFRKLGNANFNDDVYPRFTFRPLSKAMMQTIVSTWADLVQKNAVVPSRDDEDHVRNLMDFPAKPQPDEEDEDNVSVDANTALNGAQVSSMVTVIEKVSSGVMPWGTAVNVLVASFPISKVEAEAMLADVPKDLYDPTKAAEVTGIDDDDSDDEDDDTGDDGKPDDNSDTGKPDDSDDGKPDESTIGVGKLKVVNIKMSSQQKRVNFAEIDRSSEVIINEATDKVGTTVYDLTNFFIKEIETKELYGEDTDPEEVENLRTPASYKKRLQKETAAMLKYSWELGSTQGKEEIGKGGNDFTRKQKLTDFKKKFGALASAAASYFETRSFKMSGDISLLTQSIIQQEVLNGIKYSKTLDEIKLSIYQQLASKGYLNAADAEEAMELLGEELDVANPTARLNTTIRTSSFEAINEARFNYFTDPELEGFVEALEYSSILDIRTTDICNSLDGKTYAADSSNWDKYRPPNHFNCRSLLVPLIEGDKYTLDKNPTVDPAGGFG